MIKDLKKIRKELRIGDKGVATGLAKRKFSSLTKTKKYVEEALESNQLLGLSSGDYERNNKIITLFSKSLLNRIREAKEQESFDKLVDESKILNIEYSYDPSSKDKHTKITLEDLIKAKKSFQNQYTRYLSMIYNIMVSNGIKFKYPPKFDKFRKVLIPKKRVDALIENLKDKLKKFNYSKDNNGKVFAQFNSIRELSNNRLNVYLDVYTKDANYQEIEKLYGELIDSISELGKESRFPVHVDIVFNQFFHMIYYDSVPEEYWNMAQPVMTFDPDTIEDKRKRLRYLRDFSKTERTIINSLPNRFKSISPRT